MRDQDGLAHRVWIESQLVTIVCKTMSETEAAFDLDGNETRPYRPPDLQLASTVLMNLAKLKGYIVDKSSRLSAKIDLTKVPSHQVREAFASKLNDLSPGARKQLEALTFDAEASTAATDDPETPAP
jgi:hypothetical protein